MDRILIIMKKNGHQGIVCPFTGAFFHNICKHVYLYIQQISGERLQDHWSSGIKRVIKVTVSFMVFRVYYLLGSNVFHFISPTECGERSPSITLVQLVLLTYGLESLYENYCFTILFYLKTLILDLESRSN